MLTVKTWRDPYGEGFYICRPREITFQPGLTVLVGCNGAGKTTMIKNIASEAKKQMIPCYHHDNLHDGMTGGSAIGTGNYTLGANLWTSSEGEAISVNVGLIAESLRDFVKDGESPKEKRAKKWMLAFGDDKQQPKMDETKRILLLDAIDSGYSIDNVLEIKELFRLVLEDAEKMGKELYIIVSANEYELADGEQCMDVTTGKYRSFKSYRSYRSFIIKSRQKKEKRLEKLYKTTKADK